MNTKSSLNNLAWNVCPLMYKYNINRKHHGLNLISEGFVLVCLTLNMPDETLRNRAPNASKKVSNSCDAFTLSSVVHPSPRTISISHLQLKTWGFLLHCLCCLSWSQILMVKRSVVCVPLTPTISLSSYNFLSTTVHQWGTSRGIAISRKNTEPKPIGVQILPLPLKNSRLDKTLNWATVPLFWKWDWVCFPSSWSIVRIKDRWPGVLWALNEWLHLTGIMSTISFFLFPRSPSSGKLCDFSSFSLLDFSSGPIYAQACDVLGGGVGILDCFSCSYIWWQMEHMIEIHWL